MPGFNRRGPEGMGPMTGGGRGFCNPSNRSSFGRDASYPAGRGRGRGFGYNRYSGMGGRAGYAYTGSPYYESGGDEESLRSQASFLRNELKAVEKRLREMKGTDESEN